MGQFRVCCSRTRNWPITFALFHLYGQLQRIPNIVYRYFVHIAGERNKKRSIYGQQTGKQHLACQAN